MILSSKHEFAHVFLASSVLIFLHVLQCATVTKDLMLANLLILINLLHPWLMRLRSVSLFLH